MIKVYGPIQAQAQSAEASAHANKEAAEAAIKQSENSDKSLMEAERAWVGPHNVTSSNEPVAGQPYDVTVEYQNTGREPAVETIFDFLPFAMDSDQAGMATPKIDDFVNTCMNEWKPGVGSVVYPTTGTSIYNATKKIEASVIDDDVAQGRKIIFFPGCFVYKTFDVYHRSTFCFFFKKGLTKVANWNICQRGNYAD